LCTALYSDVEIRLRNKVCRADFGCMVDLNRLRSELPDKYSVRENFPGLVYKGGGQRKASGTVLLFSNGSIIITGEDNNEIIMRILGDVASDLKSLGCQPREDVGLRVVNSVAQFRIRRPVDIALFAQSTPGSKLDRSRFPAVTWRDPQTGCTIRLFRNGAGVVLGSGDQAKIKQAVYNLYGIITKLGTSQTKRVKTGRTHVISAEGDGKEKKFYWVVNNQVGEGVDRTRLTELLVRLFGPSISKTVMRNLDILIGEQQQYTLKEVGQVLVSLLGEAPTNAFLDRLRRQADDYSL
jgi:TATA-box binding protein (TBP) (component of TFIID and TFIIIB)